MSEKRTPEGLLRRKAQRAAYKKTPAGKAAMARRYAINRERIRAKARAKYLETREQVLAKQREARRSKPKVERPAPKPAALRQKEYRKRHPEKARAALVAYRAKRPMKIREYRRKAHHAGMNRPEFVVVKRLRARLYDELRFRGRKTRKFTSAINLIGCSRTELAAWIESQFKDGMSWENRSSWHIDHKRPVSSFDMLNLEQQRACFHYTNLQPLWKSENCSKGAKIIPMEMAA